MATILDVIPNISSVSIETIREPKGKSDGLWLVRFAATGEILGMLTRFKNTCTETHPWKAFKGHGMAAEFLGAFYVKGQVPNGLKVPIGGRDAAISAILRAVNKGYGQNSDKGYGGV